MAENQSCLYHQRTGQGVIGKGNGNPADVLLTLLDNLGFTDTIEV